MSQDGRKTAEAKPENAELHSEKLPEEFRCLA